MTTELTRDLEGLLARFDEIALALDDALEVAAVWRGTSEFDDPARVLKAARAVLALGHPALAQEVVEQQQADDAAEALEAERSYESMIDGLLTAVVKFEIRNNDDGGIA
jgi:hypothetical protein